MLLKLIGKSLGITEEVQTKYSDVLSDEAIVSDKYERSDDCSLLWMGITFPGGKLINFKGKENSFSSGDADLFDKLEVGDRVKVSYLQSYLTKLDYVLPDFSQKQVISECDGHQSISNIEKL